jgi:hypothetical protein
VIENKFQAKRLNGKERETQGTEGSGTVHTLFIFFIDITQTSPIPVGPRAIATFLEGEGVLVMFMVLFHVS